HIVDVTLADARRCDPDELGFALQLRDRAAAAVAHPGLQPSHQLMDDGLGAAFVCDPSCDAFRYQLSGRASALEIEFILEVAIAAATPHRTDRSHPAILLVAASLEQDQLPRALAVFCKQGAQDS